MRKISHLEEDFEEDHVNIPHGTEQFVQSLLYKTRGSGAYCTGQCCGSGSGIRCIFDPWIRDLGSGIDFFRIPDLGSQIPSPYFETIF
jgi:hypothetical protein